MPDTTLTSAELDELEREIEDGRVSRLSMHTALASRILAAARAGLEAGKAEESMRERAPLAAAEHLRVQEQVASRANLVGHAHEFYGGVKHSVPRAIRALPLTGGDK